MAWAVPAERPAAYFLAKQLGNFKALKILYCLYVAAILAAIAPWSVMTFLSSFFTGLLNPAVVFLTSYTLLQLYGLAYKKLWGMATLCFASVQLIGGLSFSGLQVAGWSYPQQFLLAGAVLGHALKPAAIKLDSGRGLSRQFKFILLCVRRF